MVLVKVLVGMAVAVVMAVLACFIIAATIVVKLVSEFIGIVVMCPRGLVHSSGRPTGG